MVTDGQVRRLHRELDSGTFLALAAGRTGMSNKTARQYRDDRTLPSVRKKSPELRTYRTRLDPCASESFEALSDGLQNALWELGGAPRRHRSDSLTAAVNNLSATREFQTRYRDLLAHYGVSGQRINVRQAHENGDAESSHGHFKTAVDQALLLRGSRDFASRAEYVDFLHGVVKTRNEGRGDRFVEEVAALRDLPEQRLSSCLK